MLHAHLDHALALVAALWIALAIDRWLGEPPARWHPVVWMGQVPRLDRFAGGAVGVRCEAA
jgi:hypothetical protein